MQRNRSPNGFSAAYGLYHSLTFIFFDVIRFSSSHLRADLLFPTNWIKSIEYVSAMQSCGMKVSDKQNELLSRVSSDSGLSRQIFDFHTFYTHLHLNLYYRTFRLESALAFVSCSMLSFTQAYRHHLCVCLPRQSAHCTGLESCINCMKFQRRVAD